MTPKTLLLLCSVLCSLLLASCAPDQHWHLIPIGELEQHQLLTLLKKETKLDPGHRIDFQQLRVFRYRLPFFQDLLLVEQSTIQIRDDLGNNHTNFYFPTTFRPVSSLYWAGGGSVVQLLSGQIQLPTQ